MREREGEREGEKERAREDKRYRKHAQKRAVRKDAREFPSVRTHVRERRRVRGISCSILQCVAVCHESPN